MSNVPSYKIYKYLLKYNNTNPRKIKNIKNIDITDTLNDINKMLMKRLNQLNKKNNDQIILIKDFLVNKYDPDNYKIFYWINELFEGSFCILDQDLRKLIRKKGTIIGEGSFGKVWTVNPEYVIKGQEIDIDNKRDIKDFLLEILINQYLSYKSNLFVRLYYIKIEKKYTKSMWPKIHCYMLMDRYTGDLKKLQFNQIKTDKMIIYIKQIYNTIKKMHSYNIISRDIKPENFLYNENTKKIVLSDLGFACLIGYCKRDYGTPRYQLNTSEKPGKVHDIYAFSIMILKILKVIEYKNHEWIDKQKPEEFKQKKLYNLIKLCYKIYSKDNINYNIEWEKIGKIL